MLLALAGMDSTPFCLTVKLIEGILLPQWSGMVSDPALHFHLSFQLTISDSNLIPPRLRNHVFVTFNRLRPKQAPLINLPGPPPLMADH